LISARAAGQELQYFNFRNPLIIDDVTVKVHGGTLAEVECLRVEPLEDSPAVRGSSQGAVRGVRVEIDAAPGQYYYLAVPDPADDSRRIIEFDARANSRSLVVQLEFTPYLIGPGQTLRLESSSPVRRTTWLGADVEASRAAHMARRGLELRDHVQSHPEAMPLAAWTEPPYLDGVPHWVWQQVKLVARLKQLADWWIDYRQIDTGEFGNGPEADAVLARLLPVVARLDGKVVRYRKATRLLFDGNRRALWPAFELDPGIPQLAEGAMELRRTHKAPPGPAYPNSLVPELMQLNTWRWLEERFEWLTKAEPQYVEVDTTNLEAIRLGARGAVSWENTGGEIAATVYDMRDDGMALYVYSVSHFARRIRMGVRRLPHGEYDLTVGREASRRVTLKPPAFVELDLPARQTVKVELQLRERKTPIRDMPDLALDGREITSDDNGLTIPIHNLGEAAAGRFRVTVRSPEGDMMAETVYAGMEAPTDNRPRIVLARFAELAAVPGVRVEVRLEFGEDALESNNAAVVPAIPRRVPVE
jgi:hypothetical protein